MKTGRKPEKEVKRKALPKAAKPKRSPEPASAPDHKKAFDRLLDDAVLGVGKKKPA